MLKVKLWKQSFELIFQTRTERGKACSSHPCCCGPGGWSSPSEPSSPGAQSTSQTRAPKCSHSARQRSGTVAKPQEAEEPHRAANYVKKEMKKKKTLWKEIFSRTHLQIENSVPRLGYPTLFLLKIFGNFILRSLKPRSFTDTLMV